MIVELTFEKFYQCLPPERLCCLPSIMLREQEVNRCMCARMRCSVLRCVAVCCCSVLLQCVVAVCCCSVLQDSPPIFCANKKWTGACAHACVSECCSVLQCVAVCYSVLQCVFAACWCRVLQVSPWRQSRYDAAGWRRPMGCYKLQVIFRKRATNYRALLRKMTCKDKASYGFSPPCIRYEIWNVGWLWLVGSIKL